MAVLEGRIALITGSARGQGLAGARLFASEGAHVIVNDLDADLVDQAVEEIRAAGGNATAAAGDISSEDDVKRILSVAEGLGGLDVLYNNAGIGNSAVKRFGIKMDDLINVTLDDWNRIIGINLTGSFLTSKYGIPQMIAKGGGSIVNTASIHGRIGAPSAHAYSASKGGLNALTRATAATYGPQGIRCNAIQPGVVKTQMIEDAFEDETTMKMFTNGTPLRRPGTAEDMAQTALWLASDASSFVTGQEIVVDGGASIQVGITTSFE